MCHRARARARALIRRCRCCHAGVQCQVTLPTGSLLMRLPLPKDTRAWKQRGSSSEAPMTLSSSSSKRPSIDVRAADDGSEVYRVGVRTVGWLNVRVRASWQQGGWKLKHIPEMGQWRENDDTRPSAEFVASIAVCAPAGPPGAISAARAELSSNGVRRARNSSARSSGASWCTSR
jgi:hypothetical protein